MAKENTTEEMVKELGLNLERIEVGLKSNPKEVGNAVKQAYEFKYKKR